MAIEPPFYPIIYVRGYAMRPQDIEATVGTPYMGFNLGSTKIRQRADGDVKRLIFESPLVRLMKDYAYEDTYRDGTEETRPEELPEKPLFIYRYYDIGSRAFGDGRRREIEDYAKGLDRLISEVRTLVGGITSNFGVYLVAHSMGGLVCRAFLQNHRLGSQRNREAVKRVFTYATPHNGIDVRVLGNRLPSLWNADNFERRRMREYLAIGGDTAVNSLAGKFDPDHFFSLVGTNYDDYGSKKFAVPEDSDGLVRIRNAFVQDGPRAFVHRSHSGQLGIVNSEEGYQILRRFLFGDLRVDGRLSKIEIDLPQTIVNKKMQKKKEVRASYHFESVVVVRGARGWDMGRRTIREQCAIFRTYEELKGAVEAGGRPSNPRLFTLFLAKDQRTGSHRTLALAVRIRVPIPDYEVGGRVHKDEHYEGSYLFDDLLVLKIGDKTGDPPWTLTFGLNADQAGKASEEADCEKGVDGGEWRFFVPLRRNEEPKFRAVLEVAIREWRAS